MKNKTIKPLLMATVLIVLGFIVSFAAFAMTDFDLEKLNSMEFSTKTYTLEEDFDNIFIDVSECDIVLIPAEDGKCVIECTDSDKIFHSVEVKDGELKIERTDNRKWYERFFGIYWGDMQITLKLPQYEYEKANIKCVSGDIIIPAGFTFSQADIINTSGDIEFAAAVKSDLTLDTVSGELLLENTEAGSVTAQSTSGDIEFASLSSSGEIYAKSVSGSIKLSSVNALGKMQVKSTSGAIKLTDVNCAELKTENVSGRSSFKSVIVENDLQAKSVSGGMVFDRSDAANLDITSTSGSVKGSLLSEKVFITHSLSGAIDVPNRNSGGDCRVETVSGSIKIEIENE